MAGITRDFSQEAVKKIQQLIKDNEEDGQWGIFDWFDDLFTSPGDIRDSLNNIEDYHREVIDDQNIGADKFDTVLRNVESVDNDYKSHMNVLKEKMVAYNEKLKTISALITPSVISAEPWQMNQIISKMNQLYLAGNVSDREQFIFNLQEVYGYDQETAEIIYELKKGIDEKFPVMSEEEKAYLFNRILGAISYDGFNWDNTAGDLTNYFADYYTTAGPYGSTTVAIQKSMEEIFEELGISEKDYNKVRYNIAIQHEFSGSSPKVAEVIYKENRELYNVYKEKAEKVYGSLTDEMFNQIWNRNRTAFDQTPDYTHQAITTATILVDTWQLANLKGGDKKRQELAGWRGDSTKEAEKTPSMGNDDYKADLDAVNISQLMKDQNISYIEASNQYYQSLNNGDYTRVEKFDDITGIEYVRNQVLDSLSPPNYVYDDMKDISYPEEKSEQEKLDYVKKHYPDSYNFIMSLENNLNDLQQH